MSVMDESAARVVGAAGLSTVAVGVSVPLADSICAHVAETRTVWVVNDASQEARLAGVPAVVDGVVGAYLGVPLGSRGGALSGVLCVFDPVPRTWTDAEVAQLQDLAEWAVAELGHVRLLAQVQALTSQLERVVGTGPSGGATVKAGAHATSEVLAAVSDALADALNPVTGLARLAEVLTSALADWCLVTLLQASESRDWRRRLRDVGWAHADEHQTELVQRYAQLRLAAMDDESCLRRALDSQTPVVLEEAATDRLAEVLAPGEARQLLDVLAPESAVILRPAGRPHVPTSGHVPCRRSWASVMTVRDRS